MKKIGIFLSLIMAFLSVAVSSAAPLHANIEPVAEASSDITVDFKLPSSLVAITDGKHIADVTVDRPYYAIYWEVRCGTDPDFYFAGMKSASAGAGTYSIIASTPSGEPVELNSGNVYTFSFSSCEFGWDAPAPIASFEVEGTGRALEQFSDITIVDFNGTLGALGYNYKKKYTVTFSAPVINVKAFAPMGMDGSVDFPVSAADQEGLKWTIDVSSMADEEGAFELHIQAVDPVTGLRLLGNYGLDHSYIVTISLSVVDPDDEEPEQPIEEPGSASITIGDVVYELSENNAIELASYPEGAVFTITLPDEAIKKVSYEIIDHTDNEILKSIADLNKGEEGKWSAVMPLTYDMIAGHVYYIHVVARDGMSSFTSNVLYEYNFVVNGSNADVAVYSKVKVVSITPDENVVITEDAPEITIAFSEAIASLEVTAILGQMMSVTLPAENISTDDHITWSVKVPEGYISDGYLSLNIVAVDNEGNRVTDAANGVGLPANCYIHYGWSSTIGLPTPSLTEDGTIADSLSALHFVYDGIGLNQDNNIATWNKIGIARDGVALNLAITQEMFSVDGDNGVGGTRLVLTLPEPLKESGVYTIHVPAYAFMLGHDQSNFYSGECDFTVTVENTEGFYQLQVGDNYLTQYAPVNAVFKATEDCKVLIEATDQYQVKYDGETYYFTYIPTNSPSNVCEIDNVSAGRAVVLSSDFVMNPLVRITTFAKGAQIPLELKTVIPAVGTSNFWDNGGLLDIAFNRMVLLSSVKLQVAEESYDVEIVHVSSSITLNVGSTLNTLLIDGKLNPGDPFNVVVTGLCDAEEQSNLYDGTGVLTLSFAAPYPQYRLLSTSVDGHNLTTQGLNDYTFLSYFSPSGQDGLFVLEFESDVKSVGTVLLQMGSRDLTAQGKYYEGTVPFQIEGNKVLVDARGTLRTLNILFPAVVEDEADEEASGEGHSDYDREHITLRISNVRDVNDNFFRAEQAGNIGSYSFYMNYRELMETINFDGDNKMAGDEVFAGEQIRLWLGSADVTFDAISVSYIAEVEEDVLEPRTVFQPEYSVEPDPYQGVIISFIMPAMPQVAVGQMVQVALCNASSPDGMPHDLSIEFVAGDPTGIEQISSDANAADRRAYNLQGQPIDVNAIPAGIPYIVNNQIHIIKK